MKHVIFDLFNCHESMLYWKSSNDFRDHIKKCVSEVALIVDESWGKFDNDAYTGTLLLSESHFSIHTWPENRSCNLDLFTCGEEDPLLAMQKIRSYLQDSPSESDSIYIIARKA
jgi:S-adenosylmethionine/arginine decarboxylase-like enzyme